MVMHVKSSRKRVYNSAEDRLIRALDSKRKDSAKEAIKRVAWMLVNASDDFAWIDDESIPCPPGEARQFAYWHSHLMQRFNLGYTTVRYLLTRAISDQKWDCYLKEMDIDQGEYLSSRQCDNLVRNILCAVSDPRNTVFA